MCEPLFALRVSDPPVAYPCLSYSEPAKWILRVPNSHGEQPVPVRDRAARRAFQKEGRVRRLGSCAREVAFALRCVALAEHLGSCQVGALAR